jgi:hypothetical protein
MSPPNGICCRRGAARSTLLAAGGEAPRLVRFSPVGRRDARRGLRAGMSSSAPITLTTAQCAGVDLGLAHPFAHPFGRTHAKQAGDLTHRHPLRLMLIADLGDHPHRPLTQLRRIPPRGNSRQDSIIPNNGVSGHPGAVQLDPEPCSGACRYEVTSQGTKKEQRVGRLASARNLPPVASASTGSPLHSPGPKANSASR